MQLQTVDGQTGRIYFNVGHMFAKNIAIVFLISKIYLLDIYWISRFFIMDEIINIIQQYKHGHMKLQLSVNNLHTSEMHRKI